MHSVQEGATAMGKDDDNELHLKGTFVRSHHARIYCAPETHELSMTSIDDAVLYVSSFFQFCVYYAASCRVSIHHFGLCLGYMPSMSCSTST